MTTAGLNNGGNKITNVAAGTAGTDGVNVSQLNQAIAGVSGGSGTTTTVTVEGGTAAGTSVPIQVIIYNLRQRPEQVQRRMT